mgnify:FL=1
MPKINKGSFNNWVDEIKIDGWKKNNIETKETILLLKINLEDLNISIIEEDHTRPLIISKDIGTS